MAGSPGAKVVGRLALKVLPDTSDFVPRLKAFAERVENQVKIELPVEIDTKKARLQFLAARGLIQATAWANPIDLDVELDTDEAEAASKSLLSQLKTLQSRLNGLGSTGGQFTQLLGRWSAMLGIIFGIVVTLGPAIATLVPFMLGLVGAGVATWMAWDNVKKLFGQLAEPWKAMKKAIGATLVKGLNPLVAALGTKFFPILQEGLGKFAGVMNRALAFFLRWITSSQGMERIRLAFDAISAAIEPFAQWLTPLTRLFVELSITAGPALQTIGDALVRVTNQFATWLQQGNGTKGITTAMQTIGDILKILGASAKAAFPAMSAGARALVPAMRGIGKVFNVVFKAITPVFEFLAAHQGVMQGIGIVMGLMAAKAVLLGAAAAILSGVLSVLGTVFSILMGVFKAFRLVMIGINLVMAANPFVLVVLAVVALGAALVLLWKHSERFRAGVVVAWAAIRVAADKVWNAIKTVISAAVGFVIKYVKTQVAILVGLWNGLRTLVSIAKSAWDKVKTTIVTAVKNILTNIKNAARDFTAAGEKLMQGLVDGLKKIGKVAVDTVLDIVGQIKRLLPGSPVKDGPLKSWNNGGAGKRLMGLLASGIRDGGSDVLRATKQTMRRVNATLDRSGIFTPTFSPSSVTGLSAQMSAQVGAIVANEDRNGPQEVYINWETGRGVMRQIADGALAAREFSARQNAVMGV